jgi:hypothetical protein
MSLPYTNRNLACLALFFSSAMFFSLGSAFSNSLSPFSNSKSLITSIQISTMLELSGALREGFHCWTYSFPDFPFSLNF